MKAVTIYPNTPLQGKEITQGIILISDSRNGDHLSMLNASYLTRQRTGAISGLATARLSLGKAKVLTVIDTGAMAFEQILGVLAVRSIEQILLFNPTREKAERFKEKLRDFRIGGSIDIRKVMVYQKEFQMHIKFAVAHDQNAS
ncbi:hypothetical protein [Virgibacillus sp. CBA3643]|uniref:hypothetical protein n=1 Tax=Virgibacillus sp. CBA3643 TaxID=2942278 RepID=UPI0035A3492A